MKPKRFASHSAVVTSFVLTFSAVSSTHAASDSWDGSTDSLWATATNWLTDTSAPGAGETATFNGTGNGNTTIDLGAGVTLGALVFDTADAAPYIIGSGAAGSQTLTLGTAGNAITMNSTVAANQTINANLALPITRTVSNPTTYYAVTNNSATNPLTIAGGISASTAGVKVLNPTGSGNTTISGAIASGSGNMSLFKTGTGTLTLSGGATFSGTGVTDGSGFASSAVFREGLTILNGGTYNFSNTEPVIGGVATNGGAGTNATLQLDNGAILNGISWLAIGRGNGTGTVTSDLILNDNSTISCANMSGGYNANNGANLPAGSVTLNGTSSLTNAGITHVGDSVGSNIALNVNSGTFSSGGDLIIGTAGTGTLEFNSGTINVATTAEKWMIIGRSSGSAGTVTINGGTLNLNAGTDLRFSSGGGGGTNVVTLNGGAIIGTSGSFLDLNRGGGATANNTFNLNGGTLTIAGIETVDDGEVAVFNFNGGTVKPLSASTTFFNLGGANQRANVRDGGAIIDTNGVNITIPQVLEHSNIDGDNATDGGLTKQGAGTLTLSGTSSYTGPTTVSAGTLNVTGDIVTSALSLGAATLSGNGFVGPVTVNNSAAVIANGNANTNILTLDALAFTTTGTANLSLLDEFDLGIDVTNNLNIGAGFTVNASSVSPWASGTTYDLIEYGSLTGSPASITKGTIAGLGGRQTATLGSTTAEGEGPGSITLTIGGDTPVWTGADSQTWTTVATNNDTGPNAWARKNAHTATNFWANDSVEFNDTYNLGSGDVAVTNSTVTIHGSVAPVSVKFDNTDVDYVIASDDSTGITTGALSKDGTGTVTLNTINTYTGATTINDGTLQLGDGTTDGDIASSSAIVNDTFGTLVFNRVGSFTYGNVISGSGDVIKNGDGTQILSGDNTMSGVTTINAGTLQIGDGGTTGTLGTSSVTNNASLVFNRTSPLTVSGVISGSGSITQAGTGAVTFSNLNNPCSGGITINSGSSILIGADNALGTGVVTLANGSTLGTNPGGALPNDIITPTGGTATLTTNGGNLTLNGDLSGSGNLNRTATGNAATVFLGGNNSNYSGTFTVEANNNAATRFTSPAAGSANAKWVNNNAFNGRVTVEAVSGGTTQFGSLTGTGVLSAQSVAPNPSVTNTIEVGHLGLNESYIGVLNQVGIGTLAVTKVGSGTWTLTGNNAYTGETAVNGGVLATGGNSIPNTGKLVINGGKVQTTGVEVVDTLFFGGVQQASGTWGASGSGADHIDDTRFAGVTGVVSVTTAPAAGYTSWADTNAPGQTMDQDHDGDGVDNGIEYFMGLSDSAFTANPTPVSGTVTWPMGGTYAGVYGTDYEVQTSTDLVTWNQVPQGTGDNTVTVGTSVVYDMPTGGKSFVRLVVKN